MTPRRRDPKGRFTKAPKRRLLPEALVKALCPGPLLRRHTGQEWELVITSKRYYTQEESDAPLDGHGAVP